MNSFISCIFVFCILQVVLLPTNAQHEDILNEYVPIFGKITNIYGGVAMGAHGADYSYRTVSQRTITNLRSKANFISSDSVKMINDEIGTLTEQCKYEFHKEECLKMKDLDIGNFTIKVRAGFDTCSKVYKQDTWTHMEYLTVIYNEISKIHELVQKIKRDCVENISSDEKVRLCLFANLYSNVLPELNILQNYDYYKTLKTGFAVAEDDVNNCFDVATEVVVKYYAAQVVNNFKYCCNN